MSGPYQVESVNPATGHKHKDDGYPESQVAIGVAAAGSLFHPTWEVHVYKFGERMMTFHMGRLSWNCLGLSGQPEAKAMRKALDAYQVIK